MLRPGHLCALVFATLLTTLPASAKQVIGQTRATLGWASASGPVDRYAVFESRNGSAYSATPNQIVSSTTAVVQGQPGTTVRIRVAALDVQGQRGPLSPISEIVQFLAAPPPPGGGGGGSGGGGGEGGGGGSGGGGGEGGGGGSGGGGGEGGGGGSSGGGGGSGGGEGGGGGSSGGGGGSGGGEGGGGATPPRGPNAVLGSIDLDSNGSADLLFFEPETGDLIAWLMDRGRQIGRRTLGRQSSDLMQPIEVADFDGDGQTDVLWHDATSGRSELWRLRGTRRAVVRALPRQSPAWTLSSCADLDGDGVTDILWSQPNGMIGLWKLTRQGTVGQTTPLARAPSGFELAGTGDLDGDGHPDLIWRNGGAVEWWKMNGQNPVATSSLPSVGAGDVLASVVDLDEDGRDDLVWMMDRKAKRKHKGKHRRVDHYLVVWFMNGLQTPDTAIATRSRSAYQVSGLSDMDGDGRPELAVQTAGQTWGAKIERRKISVRRKGAKRKRRVLRWATQWKAADGGPAPGWQVLTP